MGHGWMAGRELKSKGQHLGGLLERRNERKMLDETVKEEKRETGFGRKWTARRVQAWKKRAW